MLGVEHQADGDAGHVLRHVLARQRTGSAARRAHRPRRKHESFAFGHSGVEFPSQSRAGQRSALGPRSHLSAGRAPIAQQKNSYGARSHGTNTPTKSPTGGKLGRGPRREFQSPIRGRGRIPRHQRQNAEYGPGQTCIRAKRTTACDGLCARDRNLYTIPRKCAASSCSLGVCAPTPGWELAWNKRITH